MYRLPVVEKARDALLRISGHVPVVLYLTSRLESQFDVTTRWLKKSGLPLAPVKCRHTEVKAADWKAKYLAKKFPDTIALIDNELHVPDPLMYRGKLIEIIRHKKTSPRSPKLHVCYSWEEVEKSLGVNSA